MSLISVIIPTYNRAPLLIKAIDSALNQTVQHLEIIVVDDASSDNTADISHSYRDKRIRYFRHEKNRGVSAARNTALKQAQGKYFAFLDSDDEWFSEKLSKQLQIFQTSTNNVGLVYSAFFKTNHKTKTYAPKYRGNIGNLILTKNFIGTSTVLVKRECFLKVGFFDEAFPSCGDWDMWIRIGQQYNFEYLDELLVRSYKHTDSISLNKKAKIEGYKKLSEKYRNSIRKLPRKLRAEHYFYLGKNLWWIRDSSGCFKFLIRSILTSPSIVMNAADYIFNQKVLKYIHMARKSLQ